MTNLVFTFLGLPLLAILLMNFIGKKTIQSFCLTIGYVVSGMQIIASLASMALLVIYHKSNIVFSVFWDYQAIDGAAYFSPDFFSFVSMLCIGIVSFASFLVAKSSIGEKAFSFTNVMMVLILGMNGIALVSDLFTLYVFLEITGIASFVLISLYRDNKGLEGAFKYLVMSAVASALILCGLALIFLNSGSLKYTDLATFFTQWQDGNNKALVVSALVLLLSGFSIKAGLVPFQSWLPDAYQSAAPPVSVILAGVVTKMAGVYAILRLVNNLIVEYSPVNNAFMILGLLSIFIGALAALGQSNYKRVLAYSSISQIGYIVLGASCGSILGYLGAMLHFFNHAVFKSALFVGAAEIEQETKVLELNQLGGLQKQMPLTSASSIIAFLSAAGIPPLAGFWSKLLIIIAAWQSSGGWVGGIALFASVFTSAYFLRLLRKVFLGTPQECWAEITESRKSINIASISLTAITLVMGLAFPFLLLLFRSQGWI